MPALTFPTILVILGATGDLTARKIAPALFNLHEKKKLPGRFRVVGTARRPLSDEDFREHLKDDLAKHGLSRGGALSSFLDAFSYHAGDLGKEEDYRKLDKALAAIDEEWGICANKLFYLAVPPELYEGIFKNLAKSGLTAPCSPEEGWTRIIVEKPFGKDLETAKRLDLLLGELFREIQIYRIDHYLGKEIIQNILSFRFSNTLFEQSWSAEFIERIDIKLWEALGVEERGAFYDGIGALRDVGQNHMLQMLAFAAMEHPGTFEAEAVRSSRAALLETLRPLSAEEIRKETVRAQYEGYRGIKGVRPDSDTETYFKIPARLNGPRWRGTEITLESGKRMGEVKKEVAVTFRHPTPCLCPGNVKEHLKNKIIFSLEPREGIVIQLWAKKPGLEFEMEERTLDFTLRAQENKKQYVEEYEKLLLDVIHGDQMLFPSTREIEAMWEFIDPVVWTWKDNGAPLRFYQPDTNDILKMSDF